MNKITWISIILFALLWFFFAKFWLKSPTDEFKFFDRDKTMVFPTPKTSSLDLEPTPTLMQATNSSIPTLNNSSSTESSVIKY